MSVSRLTRRRKPRSRARGHMQTSSPSGASPTQASPCAYTCIRQSRKLTTDPRVHVETNYAAFRDADTASAQEFPIPSHVHAAAVLRQRYLAVKQKRVPAVAGFASWFRNAVMLLLAWLHTWLPPIAGCSSRRVGRSALCASMRVICASGSGGRGSALRDEELEHRVSRNVHAPPPSSVRSHILALSKGNFSNCADSACRAT